MFAALCWKAKAILAKGRKPTCFKTDQNWAGKTWFHGRKGQRVTDQPSQQGCLNSTFAWCQSHGRGMVQITRMLAGPSSAQRCQGRKFRQPCQHVRGQLAPVPPLSQWKTFWQGWWLQETTSEERHTYYEKGKGEGVTEGSPSTSSLRAPAAVPHRGECCQRAHFSLPSNHGRRRVWKLFKSVRDLWRRQIKTATTAYGSQQLNVFCQWYIKKIWTNIQKSLEPKDIHFSDFLFFFLTGSMLIKQKITQR